MKNNLQIKIFFILCLILFICNPTSFASSWTKNSDNELSWKLGVQAPSYRFEIQAPPAISDKKIIYEPNTNGRLFTSAEYRNVGLSFGTSAGSNPNEIQDKGTTDITDLQMRLYGKRTYEVFYQTYRGFYISNSSSVDSSYNGAAKIKRPDVFSKNIGLNFFWNFSDKDFSPQVAFAQSGRQNISDWSWFLYTSLSDFELGSESSFVPDLPPLTGGALLAVQAKGYKEDLAANNPW